MKQSFSGGTNKLSELKAKINEKSSKPLIHRVMMKKSLGTVIKATQSKKHSFICGSNIIRY